MIELHAEGIRLDFDPGTGLLDGFTVTDQGSESAPLHRAPWVDTGEVMPPDAAPLMARLGGDFFCAPFATSEGSSPLHGWPPNSPWRITGKTDHSLRATLERQVFGATLEKELSLLDGHPFVYQRHRFLGGHGRVPVANHANVSLRSGGFIRTSPKRHWETPGDPLEGDPAFGRSALVYPGRSVDPARFPGLKGLVDLTRYPWNPRHEDFVAGIEASGHDLGWTAVTRPVEGDLFLSLRNPRVLPMTMLWHSNGGRDYAPWSGRHVGCLGVEEGAADHMLGISSEDDLTGPGTLALSEGDIVEIRHVIGAILWPCGEPVSEVSVKGDALVIVSEHGFRREVPFDVGSLDLGEPSTL